MTAATATTIALPVQFRYLPLQQVDQVATDSRELTFSFSSENPIQRINWDIWDYIYEVLSHDPAHANLDRCNSNAAPLLWNHNTNDQRGVVVKAWIDATEKRGYSTVRFSKSAAGDQLYQDVLDGITSNISFGYRNYEMVLTTQKEGDLSTYTSIDWEVLEISFCSIPADASVGVGRSAETTNPVIIRGTMPPEENPPISNTSSAAETELRAELETAKQELAASRQREALKTQFDNLKERGRTLLDARKLSTAAYEELFGEKSLTRYLENSDELAAVDFHLKQLEKHSVAPAAFAPAIAENEIPAPPHEREDNTDAADKFLATYIPRKLY
ncbi:MAG: hypothetical protein DCF22_00625 [Leptolyngbya sp.]|nr:MAG: hypothetical protein DCF22_00625 [Leptolyngbya sp.]